MVDVPGPHEGSTHVRVIQTQGVADLVDCHAEQAGVWTKRQRSADRQAASNRPTRLEFVSAGKPETQLDHLDPGH